MYGTLLRETCGFTFLNTSVLSQWLASDYVSGNADFYDMFHLKIFPKNYKPLHELKRGDLCEVKDHEGYWFVAIVRFEQQKMLLFILLDGHANGIFGFQKSQILFVKLEREMRMQNQNMAFH